MAQIRESQFAIGRIWDEDIDMFDLSNMGIVSVEVEHEYYNTEIKEAISSLEQGDILVAQIQGEDILQPNSIWRFLEFR